MPHFFDLHAQLAFVNHYLTLAREPSFTRAELFYQSLMSRDWTFTYSDDISVWRRGSAHLRELKEKFTELCQDRDLGYAEIEATKPLLEEFVSDISTETRKQMDEWSGKRVKLSPNRCYELIQRDLGPELTLRIQEIDETLRDLSPLLHNLGTSDNRDMLIYSPHMIPAKQLASTIYKAELGKIMYGHVAISRQAVLEIDQFFQNFNNLEIEAYLTTMRHGYSRAEALSVDMGDGTRKRFMRVGKAVIALNPNSAPLAEVESDIMRELYGRYVSEKTIAKVEAYRLKLIDLINQTKK